MVLSIDLFPADNGRVILITYIHGVLIRYVVIMSDERGDMSGQHDVGQTMFDFLR